MNEIKQFNKQILLIATFAYLAIALVFNFLFPEKFHWSLLLIPAILAIVTTLLHRKLLQSGKDRPQKFINVFMAVTGIKLMIYLITVLIYVMLFTNYAIPFVIIFFSLYIIYTVIEIKSLLKYLKTLG